MASKQGPPPGAWRRERKRKASKAAPSKPRPRDWDELDDDSPLHEKSSLRRSRSRPPELAQPSTTEPTGEPALVLSVGASRCTVLRNGETLECRLPSRLAARQRSQLAVGDEVRVEEEDGAVWVRWVEPRRTVLSRPDPRNPRIERVIAANVDVVVVVVAVREPGIAPGLVDRYLIAVERGGAAPVVCANKVDLAADADPELTRLEPYRRLSLPVVHCCALSGRGIDELRRHLEGKVGVFVGHSGVGKSSLLNAMAPQLELATREVRAGDGTGRHTTTRSNLFELGGDTRLIDTPGIREFGLWELDPEEVRAYFHDFHDDAVGCRFSDCSHVHEPGCGVRAAVEDGTVSEARYQAYLRILESLSG